MTPEMTASTCYRRNCDKALLLKPKNITLCNELLVHDR